MNANLRPARWLLAPALVALVSCGGGTDGTGATPPPAAAPLTSSGAMAKGSVILNGLHLNGLHFDDKNATVLDDRNRTVADLADGMVVRVRGSSADGLNGKADRIKVENEARGAVQAKDLAASPPAFTVAGLTVRVEAATRFVNVADLAALNVGDRVEVHGLRDAAGDVRATRVERVGAGVGADELRGGIAGLDTTNKRFTLNNGAVTVHYGGAPLLPAGTTEAALSNGIVVEVRGSLSGSDFAATQVVIEDRQDAEFRGNPNEKQEVEGFVTGFSVHPGTFSVNGRAVRTTGATLFERGTAGDLLDNVRVEVEGIIDAGGVLVVAKLKFEDTRVQLQGRATGVDAIGSTLVVLGQTVQADGLTRILALAGGGISGSLADIVAGVDCVEVRGHMSGAAIVADEIKEPSGCGKDLVQANVTGETEATFTLTFFGSLNAALGGGGVLLRTAFGQVLTPAQFFAAVVPAGAGSAGTLVKVKGSFDAGVLTAEEAEIEN